MPLAVVVEDEWAIRMQIADTLQDTGWEVREFASGEQAVAFLEEEPAVVLLVTDIRLTGPVTGWDVAEAYRAANASVKVFYCSGNPSVEARQVPGSVFMPKPCRMDQLPKPDSAGPAASP
ncbi:MAG TPA: response regulator [Rhizomicrobium sp.]